MRARIDVQVSRPIGAYLAALAILGFLLGIAGAQEPSAIAPGAFDYFGASDAKQATAAIASPLAADRTAMTTASSFAEAVQKGEDCHEDCCWNCNLCPCCYAVVEALILERNLSGSRPIALDAQTGGPLLTTDDLDFPFSGGLRAYVGHRICGCWAWELGYFGLFGANASTTASGEFAFPDDFGVGTNVFFGTDRISLDYTSDIHSAELNLVCCCCCCEPCGCRELCRSVEWIYGLRYFRIDETLEIGAERDEVGGIETGSYRVETSNDLYGGQFGVRLRRCCGPWSIEGTGKAGLYYNDAHQTQTIIDFPDFVLRQSGASDDRVALVGELNATLIRQVSEHWYLRGGYNLMWIDGIALAPSQLDFSLVSTSGTTIDSGDTMFLHGLNLGVEGRW